MRLDRFLSHTAGLTRSQAQRAIRDGAVEVDGVCIRDAGLHVSPTARVVYRDDVLVLHGPQYLMVNKPVGYVCATRDSRHRTVLELIEPSRRATLHVAGRLDVDTTGLVLLTDDGAWSHRVMSPRHRIPKVYRATLAEPLSAPAQASLCRGIQLKDEPEPCAPAWIERLDDTQVRVIVTEGKYHQVKRMFAAVGNNVTALHRERIGTVSLDPALAPGAWRALTDEEVAALGRAAEPNAGEAL
jgi:16S rRNA pseudouridine516 synthase